MIGALARSVLAAVLLFSAGSKAFDMRAFVDSASELPLPTWVSRRRVLSSVPAVEAVVAVGLLVPAVGRIAATAAFVLVGAFTVVIGMALASGRPSRCACFGEISSKPISRWTLLRNVVLLGLCVAGALAPTEVADTSAVIVGLATLAAVEAALLLVQLQWRRTHAHDSSSAHDFDMPPVVSEPHPAPAFDLPTTAGRRVTLADHLGRDRPVAVCFVEPDCTGCHNVLEWLSGTHEDLAERVELLVLSGGSTRLNQALAEEHGIELLLQNDFEVGDAYGVVGTPEIVVVLSSGMAVLHALGSRDVIEVLTSVIRPPRPTHVALPTGA